jgi:hypothetical protein
MAIDRAAAAVSLALLAEQDARSATDQARGALIRDVVSGRLAGPEEFVRRADSLGMKLSGSAVAVMAVEPLGLAQLVATQERPGRRALGGAASASASGRRPAGGHRRLLRAGPERAWSRDHSALAGRTT